MKRLAPALALATAVLVSACADTGYGGGYGGAAYYDGYYDNFYGPVYDGYWGPDAFFYYRSAPSAVFIRDGAHHFRHENGPGFQHFRYQRHDGMPNHPPRH